MHENQPEAPSLPPFGSPRKCLDQKEYIPLPLPHLTGETNVERKAEDASKRLGT